MGGPRQAISYICKVTAAYLGILGLLSGLSLAAVLLSRQPSSEEGLAILLLKVGLPAVVGVLPGLAALWTAQALAGRFVQALYGLENDGSGGKFLQTRLFGQPGGGPYLPIKEARPVSEKSPLLRTGGPGALVIYNDSAVVLERAGRLTRVKRGPGIQKLEPFEKIWDIVDLRPQRWKYKVPAITQDGIPIAYEADVGFQVGGTDRDVFKAATATWVRDAWRTEPDRLMTWPKRVVIGAMEGSLRAILALRTLDDLLGPAQREQVRDELEERLVGAAPGLGVEITHVALGDIELRDQVIQQWTSTWQSGRVREMEKTLAEGKAQRTRIAEKAKAEVRAGLLDFTVRMFSEMRSQRLSRDFVILSFVDMIKRTSSSRRIYLPDDIVRTLKLLEDRCRDDVITVKQRPNLPSGEQTDGT